MKVFGIDVSTHQGNFNFKKAKDEGVEFVILRGAWGTNKDKKFETYYKDAKKQGLNVGVYLYTYAKNANEAKQEAEFLYNKCLKGKQFEMPIYIDIENAIQRSLDTKTNTQIVDTFCKTLEKLGYWAGVYADLSFFKNKLRDNELQGYCHWVAQWSNECTYKGNDGVLGLWQFGGEKNYIRTNKVAGVVCDQDYELVDYPTKIKARGKNGFKIQIQKSEELLTQIAKKVIKGDFGNGLVRKVKLADYLKKNNYPYTVKEIQNKVNELLKKK